MPLHPISANEPAVYKLWLKKWYFCNTIVSALKPGQSRTLLCLDFYNSLTSFNISSTAIFDSNLWFLEEMPVTLFWNNFTNYLFRRSCCQERRGWSQPFSCSVFWHLFCNCLQGCHSVKCGCLSSLTSIESCHTKCWNTVWLPATTMQLQHGPDLN